MNVHYYYRKKHDTAQDVAYFIEYTCQQVATELRVFGDVTISNLQDEINGIIDNLDELNEAAQDLFNRCEKLADLLEDKDERIRELELAIQQEQTTQAA